MSWGAVQPEAITYSLPRARKEHRCCECACAIQPGTRYRRVSGIWDSDPSSYAICSRCDRLREALDADVKDYKEHVPFGQLVTAVMEWSVQDLLKLPDPEIVGHAVGLFARTSYSCR